MADNSMMEPNATPPATEPALPVPAPSTPTPTLPPPSAPVARSPRPTGITIISLLALISGLLGLCCGSPLIMAGAVGVFIPTGVTQLFGLLAILVGALLAFGPLLQVIFAFGAWNLRGWAWWLGLVATGISVAGVLVAIIGSGGAAIWTAITNALVPIIIFVYLLLPETRKAFGK